MRLGVAYAPSNAYTDLALTAYAQTAPLYAQARQCGHE